MALTVGSLKDEQYREYDFGGRVYRIENPTKVYFRVGGTTHRVVAGRGKNTIVHCVPAPGVNGCILRWKTKATAKTPVQW